MRSQEQKLLDLLSNHNVTFFIPPYQRNYEWDEAQVSAFWDDVLAVYRNYLFFQGKLKAHQMAERDLTKPIDWGIAQFSVVTVELETKNPWENPQEIFESMNSLGKPLSLSDLVRNYLLMGKNAADQEKLYREYWLDIEKSVPGNIHDFVRDFIQLRTGRAQKKATQNNAKELYRVFKDYVKLKDVKSEGMLADLSRMAPLYAAVVSGKWPGHDGVRGEFVFARASRGMPKGRAVRFRTIRNSRRVPDLHRPSADFGTCRRGQQGVSRTCEAFRRFGKCYRQTPPNVRNFGEAAIQPADSIEPGIENLSGRSQLLQFRL